MSVLDDPNEYYGSPQEDWALGDIVVVPTAVLWRQGERPADVYPQPPPPPDGSRAITYRLWSGADPLPDPSVECHVTPAMIVVDDCVIDKEFNEAVDDLIRQGATEADALALARQDETLDALIPVAPVLPYASLRVNEQGVRTAQTTGYFPVLAQGGVMDEGYVDFRRTVPVSRKLLTGPLAALDDPVRRILRWKLAQFYAIRNFAVDAEIQSAVGMTITGVTIVEDTRKRLVVRLELNNGEREILLRQEPRVREIPPGHERGR